MTESERPENATEASEARQKWTAEVQDALDRTGDSLRTAWEATRDNRMSALEAAKQAVQELGAVIDKGIAAAKDRWAATEPAGSKGDDTVEAAGEPIEGAEEAFEKAGEDGSGAAEDITVTPVEDDTTGS